MYSRQGTHPQKVTGTPHVTPDPPSRPSAPVRLARAPMSDRTSRDLARQHGRRARRAAHRRMRTPAHESRALGAEARLDAQRAQQPRYDRLPRAHTHGTAHTSDALPTRSARAAPRSAAAGRSASRQSHSLNSLGRGGCKRGTRRDTIIAPLPPTEWPRQWSSGDGSAWRTSAVALMRATHLESHTCVFILKSTRACFKTASKKTSDKSSIDLDRRQAVVRAMGPDLGGCQW